MHIIIIMIVNNITQHNRNRAHKHKLILNETAHSIIYFITTVLLKLMEGGVWNHILSCSPQQEISEIERFLGIKSINQNKVFFQ